MVVTGLLMVLIYRSGRFISATVTSTSGFGAREGSRLLLVSHGFLHLDSDLITDT